MRNSCPITIQITIFWTTTATLIKAHQQSLFTPKCSCDLPFNKWSGQLTTDQSTSQQTFFLLQLNPSEMCFWHFIEPPVLRITIEWFWYNNCWSVSLPFLPYLELENYCFSRETREKAVSLNLYTVVEMVVSPCYPFSAHWDLSSEISHGNLMGRMICSVNLSRLFIKGSVLQYCQPVSLSGLCWWCDHARETINRRVYTYEFTKLNYTAGDDRIVTGWLALAKQWIFQKALLPLMTI